MLNNIGGLHLRCAVVGYQLGASDEAGVSKCVESYGPGNFIVKAAMAHDCSRRGDHWYPPVLLQSVRAAPSSVVDF
jgi:hypothetical protein